MKNPKPTGDAPEPIEPEGLPEGLTLSIAEIESIEDALRFAREEEVAEAIHELEDAGSQDSGSQDSGADDLDAEDSGAGNHDAENANTRRFVDSLKAQWLTDVRETKSAIEGPAQDAPAAGRTARTALLSADGPSRTDAAGSSLRSLPIWPMAAAAAGLALIAWYGTRDAPQTSPVYLGPDSESGGQQRQVEADGPSTAPEVLPDTVDFGLDVRKYVSFRIEMHDVTKSRRVDDGIALEVITYESKWTCPESDRRNLPDVFRLEVHQVIEAPGTAPLWSRVYARQ
ncbi:MAG: hypothetical protein ACJAQ3_003460 [Planctomycetota bacterium]|jgi:hypothetical protein